MLHRSLIGLAFVLTLQPQVHAQELWSYDCACVRDQGSKERTPPDSVFSLANAGYIALCGWKESSDGRTIFSDFSLTQCEKGHPISGITFFMGKPLNKYTLRIEGDTVTIQHLLPWPDDSLSRLVVTPVYEERYFFILEKETGEYPIIVTSGSIEGIRSANEYEADLIYEEYAGRFIEERLFTETNVINLAYAAASGHTRSLELFNELEYSRFLPEAVKEIWNMYATVARMSY